MSNRFIKEPIWRYVEPLVSAADQKAKKRSLNDYRRERDKLINDIYYGGNGIPGQPVYED